MKKRDFFVVVVVEYLKCQHEGGCHWVEGMGEVGVWGVNTDDL